MADKKIRTQFGFTKRYRDMGDGTHAEVGSVDMADRAARLLGIIHTLSDRLVQIPTIDTNIYAAGDNVGGLLTFANAAVYAAGGGVIKDVVIVDDASLAVETELWLFNQTFTPGADQAAWTPVAADLHNLLTIVSTVNGEWFTAGATAKVCIIELSRSFSLVGTSLFGRLVTRGTPTYAAATNLTVILNMLQD